MDDCTEPRGAYEGSGEEDAQSPWIGKRMMFKMLSGETVIGDVREHDIDDILGESFVLDRPMSMHMVNLQGRMGEIPLPWMNDGVVIGAVGLLAYTDQIPKHVEQQYIKATTGLQTASEVPKIQM